MSVRARRFVGPTLIAAAGTNLYTVPTGRTLIIRALWVQNASAVATQVRIGINGIAAAQQIQNGLVLGANGTSAVTTPIILNPGDQLWFSLSAAATVYVTGFGSLLLGAPS